MTHLASVNIRENVPLLTASEQLLFSDMQTLDQRDLRVFSDEKKTYVFHRNFCYATFNNEDKFSRNNCLVQLHLAGGIKLKTLSSVFGLGPQHCSNLIVRYKKNGINGICDKSVVGGRRPLITKKTGEKILQYREDKISYDEISSLIFKSSKKKISSTTIMSWVCNYKKNQEQQEQKLPTLFDSVDLRENDKTSDEDLVLSKNDQSSRNAYAGSMVLYSMLCQSDLLNVFKSKLKRNEMELPGSWTTDRIFLTLFFLHALRCKSVERSVDLLKSDFQEIVGGDFLTRQWLRYGVDKIIEDEGFDDAIKIFFKKLSSLLVLDDDVFYTDGHFSPYYGKQRLPKGYDTKKKSAHRGRNNIYLHNTNGEVLYFFESPTNTTLSVDMEDLVKNMKNELELSLKRKTLIFDRGGYSRKVFKFLKNKKMYWTTYLKNRKKERQIPVEDFKTYKINDVIEYKIYECSLPEGSVGKIRKIIFLSDNGRQIPILTTNPYMKAEEIVFLLQQRWREENCFKYMIKNFGIDLLTTYKPKQAPNKIIEGAHPERKEINKKINQKKRELEALRSELAKKILKEDREKRLDDILEKEKKLKLEVMNAEVDLDYLFRQREIIPTKQQKNLKDEHVIIKEKRRLFVNAIKVLNYNSEKWLQGILKKYYPQEDETLVTLQALWNLPGKIYNTISTVRVELESMNIKARNLGIAKMLEKLNENDVLRMPDGRKLTIEIVH